MKKWVEKFKGFWVLEGTLGHIVSQHSARLGRYECFKHYGTLSQSGFLGTCQTFEQAKELVSRLCLKEKEEE